MQAPTSPHFGYSDAGPSEIGSRRRSEGGPLGVHRAKEVAWRVGRRYADSNLPRVGPTGWSRTVDPLQVPPRVSCAWRPARHGSKDPIRPDGDGTAGGAGLVSTLFQDRCASKKMKAVIASDLSAQSPSSPSDRRLVMYGSTVLMAAKSSDAQRRQACPGRGPWHGRRSSSQALLTIVLPGVSDRGCSSFDKRPLSKANRINP